MTPSHQTNLATIYCGDALECLIGLESESIPLVVTSPPYDKLRSYQMDSAWNFHGMAQELFRALCPGGIVCWNVGDSVVDGSETLNSMRQALYFVDKIGFRMHDTMIWHKLNFSNPESARYHQVFEYVFILSKGKPRVFHPIKDKKNATAGRIGCLGVNSYSKRDGTKSMRAKYVTKDLGQRGNVWTGKTRGQEEFCKKLPHPAMMPKWLVRDLILSWSNPGDVVLDPLAGSGTVMTQALLQGRRSIAIDNDPTYCQLMLDSLNKLTPGLPL